MTNLSWAKAHLQMGDNEEAAAVLKEIQSQIKALRTAIAEEWFDDVATEKIMAQELAQLIKMENEVIDLLFDDLFDS